MAVQHVASCARCRRYNIMRLHRRVGGRPQPAGPDARVHEPGQQRRRGHILPRRGRRLCVQRQAGGRAAGVAGAQDVQQARAQLPTPNTCFVVGSAAAAPGIMSGSTVCHGSFWSASFVMMQPDTQSGSVHIIGGNVHPHACFSATKHSMCGMPPSGGAAARAALRRIVECENTRVSGLGFGFEGQGFEGLGFSL